MKSCLYPNAWNPRLDGSMAREHGAVSGICSAAREQLPQGLPRQRLAVLSPIWQAPALTLEYPDGA